MTHLMARLVRGFRSRVRRAARAWSSSTPLRQEAIDAIRAPRGSFNHPGPEPAAAPEPVRRLLLVRALQVLGPLDHGIVAAAATIAVVDGLDDTTLVELAASYADADPQWSRDRLVDGLARLGWETSGIAPSAAAVFAVRAWAGNLLRGDATGWEFASWTAMHVGWGVNEEIDAPRWLMSIFDEHFEGVLDEAPDAEAVARDFLTRTTDPSTEWRVRDH